MSDNVNNPVGRKRTHTLVAESRACSSRCCGLSSVVYHGWEGKKRGHSNGPYSYSQYWTGTSLQWRLMWGNILESICI